MLCLGWVTPLSHCIAIARHMTQDYFEHQAAAQRAHTATCCSCCRSWFFLFVCFYQGHGRQDGWMPKQTSAPPCYWLLKLLQMQSAERNVRGNLPSRHRLLLFPYISLPLHECAGSVWAPGEPGSCSALNPQRARGFFSAKRLNGV